MERPASDFTMKRNKSLAQKAPWKRIFWNLGLTFDSLWYPTPAHTFLTWGHQPYGNVSLPVDAASHLVCHSFRVVTLSSAFS